MLIHPERIGRRSLAATAFGLALLGVTASQASASYSAQVRGSTLQIEGDRASDALTLVLDGTNPNFLLVDVGDDGTADFRFDRTTFTAINVDGGAGDDTITVSRNGGSFTDEAIALDGGSGNDTLLGSDGDETLEGGPGNDFIDGNRGNDAIFGGNGADTVQWDPGDGSDAVDGDGGNDTLQFNGSNAPEDMDVSANGSRVRFFRNVGAVTMDLGTLERINVRTLGGTDNVTVGDMVRTPLNLVDVDESATGGTGDADKDNVIVNGTSGPDGVTATSPMPGTALISGLAAKVQVDNAESDQDVVTVNGLAGADTFVSSVGVSGPNAIAVNGGDDTDTARYLGSDYDDQIFMAANGTSARVGTPGGSGLDVAGVEETSVLGLGGNDTIQGQNGIAALTHFTIDGGDGDDTLGGGDGNDTLLGGPGDDHVDGNRGNDTANLGAGDDRFQWDPGDGSDFVNGQAGTDAMDFNGSNAPEKIDVFRNGSRARLTRDVAAITMDFDNLEDVVVNALGSPDTITIDDLRGSGVTDADVNLAATAGAGDAAADTVIVNGTDRRDNVNVARYDAQVDVEGLSAETHITGSEPANDALRVNTLGGNDDVTVAPDVAGLIATIVDLGTGE
jgi:Ca2+-binding RTX toxin-like protein